MFRFAGNSVARLYACLYAALSLFACAATAHGQTTIDWGNANGGAYVVPGNWVGGVIPGALDTARFNLDATYNVTFSSSPFATNNTGLLVNDGSVTLTTTGLSGSKVYAFADDATISGGDLTISSGTPKLNVQVGDLLTVNNRSTLSVINGSDVDTSRLSIADGGTIDIVGAGSTLDMLGHVQVGDTGSGRLNVSAGGSFSSAGAGSSGNLLGDALGSTGEVTINDAGSTWNSSGPLIVGSSGTGTLQINNGANVTNASATLGRFSLATGAVTISGAGSTWTNSGVLRAGERGMGTLTIDGGGEATNNDHGFLGVFPGSTGTATVTGADSTWTNTGDLVVGQSGSGALSIADGGTVASSIGRVGLNGGSNSEATVTGAGSTWSNSGFVDIGVTGTGMLDIASGGAVSNTDGFIGRNDGSNGAVTVSGAGSTWTNSGDLRVANEGTGTLTIEAGGVVSNQLGIIGDLVGSSGSATVTGAGSVWTNTGSLVVGLAGAGSLEINDGGAVSDANGVVGELVDSIGTVTVRGAGSNWTSNTQFDSGGSGWFLIGNAGQGTLNIEDGGSVNNVTGAIGNVADSVGAATVTGPGSTWTNSTDIIVGFAGGGTLDISDGGTVTSTHGNIGWSTGSSGTVTVTGAGSTWTNSTELRVGNAGTATLSVTEGGAVTSTNGSVGFEFGSNGEVTVSGAGSIWTNSDDLTVAEEGTGTLTIDAGGTVSNGLGIIGNLRDSNGATIVRGGGSTWTNNDSLFIGAFGTGTLLIEDGGQVLNNTGIIAHGSDSVGTVDVRGAGSTWTSSSSFLIVGSSGTGTLTIEDGGAVTNAQGVIAHTVGSSGSAVVTGADSTWTNTGSLTIGGDATSAGGTGVLVVAFGGTVNVAMTTKIWNDGTINLNGGTLNTGALEFAGSTFNFTSGTLNISGSQAVDSPFLEKVLGPGQLISSGQNLLLGGVTTLTQPLTLDGGTLSVSQLVNAPLLELQRGTLHLTDQMVTIEAGGLFGDRLHLQPDVILNIDQGITNQGLILGSGLLGGPIVNAAAGELRAEAGHTLTFTGATADNSGDVRLLAGIVDFHGPLTNTAAGRITGRGTLIARAGLVNQGHVALSSGITDVIGDVTNDTNDPAVGITVSGNADVTFWDHVANTSGLLRVSAGSSATFFGAFSGNGISGSGDVFLEADITPGTSPGLADFGGNVHVGELASLQIEIGGTTKGSQYDALDIAGTATLDGLLGVSLLGDFEPGAGDVFEILTAAGGVTGTFATELLPALAGDLFWNINYDTDSVSLAVAAPGLPGDYNQDGAVDAADYIVWRKTDGSPEAYNTWRANFGRTAASGAAAGLPTSAAVPEPAALVLLIPALSGATAGRFRRRRR